jgi:hypothetical protein
MSAPQTYANHRRIDSVYHFFALPVALLAPLAAAYYLFRHPDLHHALTLIVTLAALVLALKIRSNALLVQDRVIRLEETIRMQRLLPADHQGRIQELTPKQMVGLRFASDGELTDRVREAVDQNLDGEAIKKRIQSWRADTFRV